MSELVPPQKCTDCRYALLVDEGWSNYTVEGTKFWCSIGKHPNDGFDRFYGEDQRLDYALSCRSFIAGPPIEIDVDHENTMTIQQAEWWYEWRTAHDDRA